MNRPKRLILALLALLPAVASAEPEVALRYETGPAAIFQNDGEYGVDGTRYHASDVGQTRNLLRVERTSVELGLGRHAFILLYAPFEVTTRATLDEELRFRGATFASGAVIDHRYLFDGYRASYLYRLLEGARLSLDLGGSLQIRNAEVAFATADGSLRESENDIGVVFALKARLRHTTAAGPWAELEADALSTFGLLGDTEGAIYDLALSAGLPLADSIDVFVSLRLLGGGADVPDRAIYNWGNFGSATAGLRIALDGLAPQRARSTSLSSRNDRARTP
jgi:hypothetical protein